MIDVDTANDDAIVVIAVDRQQMQRDVGLKLNMLEQMVANNYDNAEVNTTFDHYGLITYIWIKFNDSNDATDFKLRYEPNEGFIA